MKGRLVLSAIIGIGLFGMSQASLSDWDSGPCTGGGPAPCIEFDSGSPVHFNGSGGHADIWHGPDGDAPDDQSAGDTTNTFEFCGETVLHCEDTIIGEAEVTCDLCLYGQVRKCFSDTDDSWFVNIRVLSGTTTPGDFFCNFIGLGGFPWYVGPNSYHGPYTDDCSVGIEYSSPMPTPIVGSIGEIDVGLVGVSNAHLHNVSYDNINTFSFNSLLVNGPGDTSTTCTVVSVSPTNGLQLQPAGDTLSIH